MAIIAQKILFGWEEIEILGDLERLQLVLNTLPDETLMNELEKERDRGRNDYPVRAMWNSLLAGIVFQHPHPMSLCRELLRNGQLRRVCGFDFAMGFDAVPKPWNFTRFFRLLFKKQALIDKMFDELVSSLTKEAPGFGKDLAIDGKHVKSYGKPVKDEKKKKCADGRRDTEADWGVKTYHGIGADGKAWKKVMSWFGYKVHLMVDCRYEVPVAYTVERASVAEQPVGVEMIKDLAKRQPELAKTVTNVMGDKGYDGKDMISAIKDELHANPVIDIRNLRKDGEATRVLPGTENVVYDFKGTVFCVCLKTGKQQEMAYGGFESKRGCHKYLCPALCYGYSCAGADRCPVKRQVRIKLDVEPRIFTPVARSTYKWKRLYRKRTAVERTNSRIDVLFGFEQHTIRGMKKMNLRAGMAFLVMLSMALGRVRQKKEDLARSLVKTAA